jgi:NADPH-dependent ferric siderophore reductase
MTMSIASARQSSPRGSLFDRAIARLLTRPARVTDTVTPSAKFRLIDLDSEGLKDCVWSPGDKIQLEFDGGLTARSYTPIMMDRAAGRTRILAYHHGTGPGSEWVRDAALDDGCQILGPRNSLDLSGLTPPTVVFGDETSFGLAAALQRNVLNPRGLHAVFEVNALSESLMVLDTMGIVASAVIERRPDQSHLAEVTETILRVIDDCTTFVLTGRSASIRHVARALKGRDVTARRLKMRAYWTPERAGLD